MDPIISILKKRELLWQFLLRNVKQRHRGSVLGAFWLIANPLLMLGLYVFAFGIVFGGRRAGRFFDSRHVTQTNSIVFKFQNNVKFCMLKVEQMFVFVVKQ